MSGDGLMSETEAGHRAAFIMPFAIESPMVLLFKSIGQLIAANGVTNHEVNKGLANLILGAETLIKIQGSWGRLNRQLLLNQLDTIAFKIGFDLASREFTRDQSKGGTS